MSAKRVNFGAHENLPSSAELKLPALGTGLGTETTVVIIHAEGVC